MTALRRLPLPDDRLQAAFELTPPCRMAADIGADHGRLSALLLGRERCERMLVSDISPSALSKARQRLHSLGLEDRCAFAVADGLGALDQLAPQSPTVQAFCILGMGGDTIAGILACGQARLEGATLVLGPHTEAPLVRARVAQIGYRITEERLAGVGRYLYVLMQAQPAPSPVVYTERELLLGPCLLASPPPLARPWLERMLANLLAYFDGVRALPEERKTEPYQRNVRHLAYVRELLDRLPQLGKEESP